MSNESFDTNLITVNTEKHSFPASDSPTLKSNCFFKVFYYFTIFVSRVDFFP